MPGKGLREDGPCRPKESTRCPEAGPVLSGGERSQKLCSIRDRACVCPPIISSGRLRGALHNLIRPAALLVSAFCVIKIKPYPSLHEVWGYVKGQHASKAKDACQKTVFYRTFAASSRASALQKIRGSQKGESRLEMPKLPELTLFRRPYLQLAAASAGRFSVLAGQPRLSTGPNRSGDSCCTPRRRPKPPRIRDTLL